jgi:flagellar export protein FliJ
MQRFVFRLEAVRSLREQRQQQAQQELASQLRVREQRARELQDASLRVGHALSAAAPAAGTTTTAQQLAARHAWVERVHRDQDTARDGLALQETQVAAGRERLHMASREREVLERLRACRLSAHEREAARRDEAALGEVALAAHRRRAGEAAA